MAERRKDAKGRNLKDGENQMPDGRYRFRYIDRNGRRQAVYSWRLVPTDKVPAGKREDLSLREKEKIIESDNRDGIDGRKAAQITLNDMFALYMAGKNELKQSTRGNYQYMYKNYVSESLGLKKIGSIKYSDIKAFYNSLIRDKGFKPNSMEIINTILHPTFTLAVRDGYIRTNPTDGVMQEIKKSHSWEKPKRYALSIEEQEAFINFMADSDIYRHWLPLFTVFLGTGCRVGDADGKISLNQQKPSKHAGLRRFGPEKFLQRNNEFMKERPIFYKKPIKTEKDFSTWLRCFYYTTKAVITEYIYF